MGNCLNTSKKGDTSSQTPKYDAKVQEFSDSKPTAKIIADKSVSKVKAVTSRDESLNKTTAVTSIGSKKESNRDSVQYDMLESRKLGERLYQTYQLPMQTN